MNRKNQAKKLEDTTRRTAEALEAARMKRCGLTLKEIGAKLGCSLQKAHVLVHEGIDAYREQAREEIAAWVEGAVAEQIEAKREAWIQWERSKQDAQRKTTKRTADGIEKTKTTEGQCGDPRYLAEIRGCNEFIGKLFGVIRTSINVNQQTGIRMEQPSGQDGPTPFKLQMASMLASILPPSVVDGHLLANGNGKAAPEHGSAEPANE
ncbi:MAG: hypothetical protein ABR915_18255 [Thermoguttaceae bacterium]|jgi:hypothetical protein